MTNSIGEIEDAGCIFVIGSNTTACHPLVARRIYRAKEKGAKLIVADPRNIQLSRFADVAVNQRLGSDVALLNGMMHIIIANGWHDKEYIEARTEGYADLQSVVDRYTLPVGIRTVAVKGTQLLLNGGTLAMPNGATGSTILACDTVNAGPGDLVLVEQEGNAARQLLGTKSDPFHSVIVGVVDRVDI